LLALGIGKHTSLLSCSINGTMHYEQFKLEPAEGNSEIGNKTKFWEDINEGNSDCM